jgi:hypothetical protein
MAGCIRMAASGPPRRPSIVIALLPIVVPSLQIGCARIPAIGTTGSRLRHEPQGRSDGRRHPHPSRSKGRGWAQSGNLRNDGYPPVSATLTPPSRAASSRKARRAFHALLVAAAPTMRRKRTRRIVCRYDLPCESPRPGLYDPSRGWRGQAPRQPGQVRKEAAVTSPAWVVVQPLTFPFILR